MSYYGMALKAVGDTMQIVAAGMAANKMSNAYNAAQRQQEGYKQQGANIFSGALQPWSPGAVQTGLAEGKAGRLGAYQDIQGIPSGSRALSSDPRDAMAMQAASEQQAGLNAYGDWLFKQSLKNLATQRQLGQLSSFAGGTASLLPLQMYQAQHSYDWLNQIGQSFSQFGGGQFNPGQQQQAPPSYTPAYVGGAGPAAWSGYGSLPPAGTWYNPQNDTNNAPYAIPPAYSWR